MDFTNQVNLFCFTIEKLTVVIQCYFQLIENFPQVTSLFVMSTLCKNIWVQIVLTLQLPEYNF